MFEIVEGSTVVSQLEPGGRAIVVRLSKIGFERQRLRRIGNRPIEVALLQADEPSGKVGLHLRRIERHHPAVVVQGAFQIVLLESQGSPIGVRFNRSGIELDGLRVVVDRPRRISLCGFQDASAVIHDPGLLVRIAGG